MGVPTLGCDCPVCTSKDPRNKRTRASLLVTVQDRNFVIDTSTDFRTQALREGLKRLDAVLYTHSHADHILGLDDLRPYSFFQKFHIPCFGNEPTMENICEMFKYVFTEPQPGGSIPRIEPRVVSDAFEYNGVKIQPIPVVHGKIPVFGYRIGDSAYLTDLSEIPDESYRMLRGLKILVLGVLRYKPHPTHLTYEKALEIVSRLEPEQTFFTHISHDFEHERTGSELPPGVFLAYDGLTLETDEP